MILKMINMIIRFNYDYEIRGMDEVTYTTRQRKLYKTNKCHLIIAIIGAEDEKIDQEEHSYFDFRPEHCVLEADRSRLRSIFA